MLACILLIIHVVVLSADSSAPTAKVDWSYVIAAFSILFNVVLSILLFLLNRKQDSDKALKNKNQQALDDAVNRVREGDLARQQYVAQLDQIRRELDSIQDAVGDLADSEVVDEIRKDFRTMKRDLEEARISLAGHQNGCADRFVHRATYSEDQRAQREAVGLLHEMLKQQRDIIERIRP